MVVNGAAHEINNDVAIMNDTSLVSDASPALAFPVIGVGASAGGLEAIEGLFQAFPADAEIAIVLVTHSAPQQESLLADLLARYTRMTVSEVAGSTEISPRNVYVTPPGKNIAMQGTRLELVSPDPHSAIHKPIDYFFHSLARAQKSSAIAVILSGALSDGTLGLRSIKEYGGLSIVQEPSTAAFDGMPRSAISSGLVDMVCAVEGIPEAILNYVRQAWAKGAPASPQDPADAINNGLGQILTTLNACTGYDFRHYKESTLLRRIHRRMVLNGVTSVGDYEGVMRKDPAEAERLLHDLLINVTRFFREADAWKGLAAEVLPRILGADGETGEARRMVRAWVAGCATGEEAYTLAMLLDEACSQAAAKVDFQIFATDVDEPALEVARHGIYPASIEEDISPERLARYFEREEVGGYRIRKQLRDHIIFATQNLISDPPYSRLDLVTCRNLLIYLESPIQQRIIDLFHFTLREGGYLMLGSSETVGAPGRFKALSKPLRLFQAIPGNRPLPPHTPQAAFGERIPHLAMRGVAEIAAPNQALERALLKRALPACAVIHRNLEIHGLYGPIQDFLDLPMGELGKELSAFLGEGLRHKVRVAVQTVISGQAASAEGRAKLYRNNQQRPIRFRVEVLNETAALQGLYLVTFHEDPEGASEQPAIPHSDEDASPEMQLVAHLEKELAETRYELQSSIEQFEASSEELKAANEEMVSMNEELQSSNEELESSKEELQSLNEELSTTNNQLQEKIQETEAINNDLNNFFSGTDIATLFLDAGLCIRRFTPATNQLFHIIPSDIGRPIQDLSQRFSDPQLWSDAKQVLEQLSQITREVKTQDGHWFNRCVLPFRTLDNRIEGVIINFTDITRLKQSLRQLERNEERLNAAQALSLTGSWEYDRVTGKGLWSRHCYRLFGYNPGDPAVTYDNLLSRIHPDDRASWREAESRSRTTGEEVGLDFRYTTCHGESRFGHAVIRSTRGAPGEELLLAGTIQDITARKRIEEALRRAKEEAESANRAKSAFLSSMSHELRTPLNAILGYAQILQADRGLSPRHRQAMGVVRESGNDLLELINDVLDLAKIEAGRFELLSTPCEVHGVFAEIVKIFQLRAKDKGLRFTHHLAPSLPRVLPLDGRRLRQVVTNLLDNAFKFTESGGVTLGVDYREGVLGVEVADTGIGIQQGSADLLFRPFVQEGDDRYRSQGTGLGLAISKSLIEQMGGKIGVEGAPAKGSRFYFSIPASPYPQQDAVESRRQSGERVAGYRRGDGDDGPLRILVVDDMQINREIMRDLVESLGFTVSDADGGERAIAMVRSDPPDLVLMDLVMPEVSGIEATKRIRALPGMQSLPIVACSASALKEDRENALSAGCNEHIAKPVELETVMRVFGALLPIEWLKAPDAKSE